MSIASDIRRDAEAKIARHLDGVASTMIDALKAEAPEDRAGIFDRIRAVFCFNCGSLVKACPCGQSAYFERGR